MAVTAPPPWTDEGRQDPMPWCRQMRELAPVTPLPEIGAIVVLGRDEVRAALGMTRPSR